jgi:cardiolipin synthase (CMP-forming)
MGDPGTVTQALNFPNLITIGRILLVPLTIWLLISQEFPLAFAVFIVAGVSDGVDGYLARVTNSKTELGAYLDPIADKALLVSVYGALGIIKILPAWLVLMVITRDILIVGGVMLAWLMEKPLVMKPLWISKVNTAGQIIFAGLVLGVLSTDYNPKPLLTVGIFLVAALTILSGAFYIRDWVLHMGREEGAT